MFQSFETSRLKAVERRLRIATGNGRSLLDAHIDWPSPKYCPSFKIVGFAGYTAHMKSDQANSHQVSDAEQALTSCLQAFQRHVARIWKGREKEALIALVRALDSIAAASYWERSSPTDVATDGGGRNRATLLMGAAHALRPFLSAVKGQGGGAPFGPSHPEIAQFSYSYLFLCGKLAFLRRMAALEHYGLASTKRLSHGEIRIETTSSSPEQAFLSAFRKMSRSRREHDQRQITENQWKEIHARMSRYVDTQNGWFIRYDNDWEIVSAYREQARRFAQGFPEAEALPNNIIIFDRSFGEWKEACEQALGRILAHMDFAALLKEKEPGIALANVLTIFARREDVEAVWKEAGLSRERVRPTMQALTLEIDGVDDWERAYETPSTFYVDLGRDFVLLPCFGAISNPYFALFRHLRQTYRKDWDRGVDRREAVFRSDLAKAFPGPRFMVPPRGYRLRRSDGSLMTDVDAIIIDTERGVVVLAQLKWHDVFGFSLAERESRRRNIIKANEWVERVSGWVNGRSSADVLRELRIQAQGSDRPPLLYVVARYAARFSGEHRQDPRASWLGWPEILHAVEDDALAADPLSRIPAAVLAHQRQFESPSTTETHFQFPGLKVTLQTAVPK